MPPEAASWRQYEEDVAALFRAMGLVANVGETIVGARAEHKIDVVVRPVDTGLPILWIAECKHWSSPVGKEQVMTLMHIAQDVGADRAFLLSETGFQSGALRAVRNTNVTLASLAELTEIAKEAIATTLLNRLLIEKSQLEKQLHSHLFNEHGQSPSLITIDLDEVASLLGACFEIGLAINRAMVGEFPVVFHGLQEGGGELIPDASTLGSRLGADVELIKAKAQTLELGAQSQRQNLLSQVDQLISEVRNLLELSAAAFAVAVTNEGWEDARRRCLSSMRTIGDLADNLRGHLRGQLANSLKALMRELIDGVYLELAKPRIDHAHWAQIRARTLDAMEAFGSTSRREGRAE